MGYGKLKKQTQSIQASVLQGQINNDPTHWQLKYLVKVNQQHLTIQELSAYHQRTKGKLEYVLFT